MQQEPAFPDPGRDEDPSSASATISSKRSGSTWTTSPLFNPVIRWRRESGGSVKDMADRQALGALVRQALTRLPRRQRKRQRSAAHGERLGQRVRPFRHSRREPARSWLGSRPFSWWSETRASRSSYVVSFVSVVESRCNRWFG